MLGTPPLTPSASGSRDTPVEGATKGAPLQKVEADSDAGPEIALTAPPSSSTDRSASRPDTPGQLSTRPTSLSAESNGPPSKQHRAAFSIGPNASDSTSTSREASPSRAAAATAY